MTTPQWFRSENARLVKLAAEAKETGNTGLANLLTEAADRYLNRAVDLEAAEATKTATHDGPLTLQQQQIQPKKED